MIKFRSSATLCLLLVFLIILNSCSPKKDFMQTADDISKISSAAGFLASKVEEKDGFIGGTDQVKNASDYAYLYDNAIAAIALSYAGAHQHAQKIADAIVFAQSHDRTYKDGRLRNAYVSGNPKSDSGRSIVEGQIVISLPGFWADGHWQENAYSVSTSTGNMAWALLALCKVAENAPTDLAEEYIEAAKLVAEFLLTLKSDTGGFTGGYEGWDNNQTKVTYKSTEHNIDLICAFSVLAKALEEKDSIKAKEYKEASEHAKEFVLSMYDEDLHCYYTGTKADGKTISKGVIPLDTNSLTILALGAEVVDAYKIISFVEKSMKVGGGFDFSAGDLDGIWNEGTAQMTLCYSILGESEKYEDSIAYLNTQSAKDGSIPAADRDGVSTGFVIVGSDDLWEFNNTQSISATGWFAFAQMERNPFE